MGNILTGNDKLDSTAEDLRKRFDSQQPFNTLEYNLRTATKWNLSELANVHTYADSTFVHVLSNTTLPVHNFVLKRAVQTIESITGCNFDASISSMLSAFETIDISSATMQSLWYLLYGRNIFEEYENELILPPRNKSRETTPFDEAMKRIMPSIRIWNAFRCLSGNFDYSGWITDFGTSLKSLFLEKLKRYVLKARPETFKNRKEHEPEWNTEIAFAIQSCAREIIRSDPGYGKLSVQILRPLYNLASVLLPTDESSRVVVWSWFISAETNPHAVMGITSAPYLDYVEDIRGSFSSYSSTFKPFGAFKKSIQRLHRYVAKYGEMMLYDIPMVEENRAKELILSPVYNIKIFGTRHSYLVKDFVLLQWRYFRRLLESGMTESRIREIELPNDFSLNVLKCILAILHGVNLVRITSHDDFVSSLTDSDMVFLLNSAVEYSLVPNSSSEAIPSDPVSQRFNDLLKYCYRMVGPIAR